MLDGNFDLDKLLKIKQDFFSKNTKQLFKSVQTNKNLHQLVCFVYNVVNFGLSKEGNGREDLDDDGHTATDISQLGTAS